MWHRKLLFYFFLQNSYKMPVYKTVSLFFISLTCLRLYKQKKMEVTIIIQVKARVHLVCDSADSLLGMGPQPHYISDGSVVYVANRFLCGGVAIFPSPGVEFRVIHSPRLVVPLRLENPVCPIIYPLLEGE